MLHLQFVSVRRSASWSMCSCHGRHQILRPLLLAQVGGFLQRIDYVRKHAFAVMCILKNSEGQFPIRCYPLRIYHQHRKDTLGIVALVIMQERFLHGWISMMSKHARDALISGLTHVLPHPAGASGSSGARTSLP